MKVTTRMDSLSDREENLPEFEEELEGKGEVPAATELRLVYSLPTLQFQPAFPDPVRLREVETINFVGVRDNQEDIEERLGHNYW